MEIKKDQGFTDLFLYLTFLWILAMFMEVHSTWIQRKGATMATNPDAVKLLHAAGVLAVDTPAVLVCEKHLPPSINVSALYMNTPVFVALCRMLAAVFLFDKIHSVMSYGPLAEGIAGQLTQMTGRTVGVVRALHPLASRQLQDTRVLLVTEAVTTGASLRRLAALAEKAGAHRQEIVAGAIITQGIVNPESVGVTYFSTLVDLSIYRGLSSEHCCVCHPRQKKTPP